MTDAKADTKADPQAKKNPLQVILAEPLKTPGGEVKTITFRRGKAKDMMQAQRVEPDGARRELVLMSMLTEEKLTPEDLEELDLADLAEVQAVFQTLFRRAA
jgi:uncharacterized protein (DUF885 family)